MNASMDVARGLMGRMGVPGRLDPLNPAGVLIFDTAGGGWSGDAITRFFAADMDRLDWLADFLMVTDGLVGEDDDEPDFKVEPDTDDDHYDKKALTTTATDDGWDL